MSTEPIKTDGVKDDVVATLHTQLIYLFSSFRKEDRNRAWATLIEKHEQAIQIGEQIIQLINLQHLTAEQAKDQNDGK